MKKLFLIFAFIVFCFSANATTYYVSKGGSDTNNGLSWANSFLTIDYAIGIANANDSVFVAVGTYDGFSMKNGVHCLSLKKVDSQNKS